MLADVDELLEADKENVDEMEVEGGGHDQAADGGAQMGLAKLLLLKDQPAQAKAQLDKLSTKQVCENFLSL